MSPAGRQLTSDPLLLVGKRGPGAAGFALPLQHYSRPDQAGPGVRAEFINDQLIFAADALMASLFLSVTGAFAELEHTLICERQREGITPVRQRGAYRGRNRFSGADQIDQLTRRRETKSALAREFNISREPVYQYLRTAAPTLLHRPEPLSHRHRPEPIDRPSLPASCGW